MTDNFYYNPEKSGLTILTTLDESDMSYEFNTFVIWEHKDGRLFYAEDSGCSCPTPFENFTELSSLNRITKTSLPYFEEELKAWNESAKLDIGTIQKTITLVKSKLRMNLRDALE